LKANDEMTKHESDRALAFTLKAGAYTAFVLVLAGIILQNWVAAGSAVADAGLLVLLATPVLRILVAAFQFWRERDSRYVLVSLGVLGIMVLAYALGIKA
jgi:glucose-6-phosphate-specific signal transduction histidine kinase